MNTIKRIGRANNYSSSIRLGKMLYFATCLLVGFFQWTAAHADSLDKTIRDKEGLPVGYRDLAVDVRKISPRTYIGTAQYFKVDFPYSILKLRVGKAVKTIHVPCDELSNAQLPSLRYVLSKGRKVKVSTWKVKGSYYADTLYIWPLPKGATAPKLYSPPKTSIPVVRLGNNGFRFGSFVISGVSADGAYVTGTVANESGRAYRLVTIRINLYDLDGNQIGNTHDAIYNMEAHGRWKFRAVNMAKSMAKFKIVGIEAQ